MGSLQCRSESALVPPVQRTTPARSAQIYAVNRRSGIAAASGAGADSAVVRGKARRRRGRESARARLEAPVFAGGHDPSRVHVVHNNHHLVAAREPARLGVVAERGAPCCVEFEERHPSRHQHNKMSLAECSRVNRERQRIRPLVQPDCKKWHAVRESNTGPPATCFSSDSTLQIVTVMPTFTKFSQ